MTIAEQITKRSERISKDVNSLVSMSMSNPEAITVYEIEDFLTDIIRSIKELYEPKKTDRIQ